MSAAAEHSTASSDVPSNGVSLALSPKYDAFNIVDVTYKKVQGTAILASILTPKTLKPGKHPLAIRWHGGCLITGHRLYPDWYPPFILDFCLKHEAVVVTPDHRLLPEATGPQILDDVDDFFTWLRTPGNLTPYLPAAVSVDTDNILVTGESAGGWLAWQSGARFPGVTRAVIVHYPMLDIRAPHFTQAYEKKLFDPPAPQIPAHVLQDFLAGLRGDEVVPAAIPPDRLPVMLSALQQGRFTEFFGTESTLYPLELLERPGLAQVLPPTWIAHGRQDSVVPVEGTRRYVEKLRTAYPGARVHVSLVDGDHGFDTHATKYGGLPSLDTDWVQEGIKFTEQFWPVSGGHEGP